MNSCHIPLSSFFMATHQKIQTEAQKYTAWFLQSQYVSALIISYKSLVDDKNDPNQLHKKTLEEIGKHLQSLCSCHITFVAYQSPKALLINFYSILGQQNNVGTYCKYQHIKQLKQGKRSLCSKTNKRDRYEGVTVKIRYLWFKMRYFDKSYLNTDTGSAFQLPSIYKNSRGFVLKIPFLL